MRTLALAALVCALAGCTPMEPCQDDYCRQARLTVLQGIIANQSQYQWHPVLAPMPYENTVRVQPFSCTTNLGVTSCQ